MGSVGQGRIFQQEGGIRPAGLFHILKGESVGGIRHDIAGNSVAPYFEAEVGHGEMFRTDDFALAAHGTAVHHHVGRGARTLDHSGIAEEAPRVKAGKFLVFLKVDAFLHTLHTRALQAAGSFGSGFFRRPCLSGGKHAGNRGDVLQVDVQAALPVVIALGIE